MHILSKIFSCVLSMLYDRPKLCPFFYYLLMLLGMIAFDNNHTVLSKQVIHFELIYAINKIKVNAKSCYCIKIQTYACKCCIYICIYKEFK